MFELLIKNGKIVDGTGSEPYFADIGISNGKITAIGEGLSNAARTIDASGLTVTPGFIDSHSHSDNAVVSHPEMIEKCEQGITTSIGGQCGTSSFPSPRSESEVLRTSARFFDAAEDIPLGSNLLSFVGHSTIRRAVMGTENRAPNREELEKMKALVREAVSCGAVGMSTGLIYIPGSYADTAELIELSRAAAEAGGMLSSHIRNESNKLIEAVSEFIEIAKAAGAKGVISHHKACFEENFGKVNTTLKMIDEANANGADIYMDVYPYTATSTTHSIRFIPKEYFADGKVLQNLADPKIREEIKSKSSYKGKRIDWVLINSCGEHTEYVGKYVSEIADMMGCDDLEAALRIVELSKNRASSCSFTMNENDVATVIAHPRAMICTDSGVAKGASAYHPRLRASFPRAIRRFARELGVVTLPEMIRKMTSLPAHVYSLREKGQIKLGFDADICIFDYEKLSDKADYANPHARAEGLNYVIAAGTVIAENSVYTGAHPCKVIRYNKNAVK